MLQLFFQNSSHDGSGRFESTHSDRHVALRQQVGVYMLAVALPIATLFLRQHMPVSFGARPLLILFMPAIILPAMQGGLWSGLVATVTAGFCTAYFLIPPLGNISMAASHDVFQWGMLLASGVLVSLLSELMHRSIRRECIAREGRLASEARFRLLFEANTTAMMVTNDLAEIVMTNPECEILFGYAPGELLHQPIDNLVPEQYREKHTEQRKQFMRHPTKRYARDLHGKRKDGTIFPAEVVLSPYQEWGQDFVLVSVNDISARKEDEQKILRLNESLERRVTERTAELQTARQEAERLASVKGNFLANMSHEIRTPMNAIIGLAYLLEKTNIGNDERELVKKIQIAGRSLMGIINDILDFSKIESGRLEIEHVPFHLNQVLENLATLMSTYEKSNKVEVIISPVPADLEYLRGDALRLEQVLINLAGNALKFTQRGHVNVSVARQLSGDGKAFLRFSVADTGIGIAPEKQFEIFNAFSQEDVSTTRRFGGSGLGLSICQKLVRLMGGELGLISEQGKGSEFWFTIPFEMVPADEYAPSELAFQNVLVVDDHPIAREVMGELVRSLGWNVEVVESGEQAIQRVTLRMQNNRVPDLILLDWLMPGMDGVETGRKVREMLGHLPKPPIIVMATAHDREALAAHDSSGIADAILNKPVTASALYNVLGEIKSRLSEQEPPKAPSPDHKRLEGLHVLTVDDSEINREVVQRILTEEGAIVTLAENGRDALERLRNSAAPIDVVLMDIQMPVMDGYEATRLIHEWPGLELLPVFALTAGAFNTQKAAALDAGMKGFIPKPFNIEEMVAILSEYVEEPVPAKVSAPSVITAAPGVLPILDVARGLGNWGDMASYHKYLRKFLSAHGQDGNEISLLLQKNAPDKALALVHKLKGSAGNLALMEVCDLASKLEQQLSEQLDGIGDLVAQLQQAIERAGGEIARRSSEEMESVAANTLDKDSAKPLLFMLMHSLDRDNPDEAEPFLAALENFVPSYLLKPIREDVDNFDFRGAERQILGLAVVLGISIQES